MVVHLHATKEAQKTLIQCTAEQVSSLAIVQSVKQAKRARKTATRAKLSLGCSKVILTCARAQELLCNIAKRVCPHSLQRRPAVHHVRKHKEITSKFTKIAPPRHSERR